MASSSGTLCPLKLNLRNVNQRVSKGANPITGGRMGTHAITPERMGGPLIRELIVVSYYNLSRTILQDFLPHKPLFFCLRIRLH